MKKKDVKNLRDYVRNGFGAVRPYLYGPTNYDNFIREVFDATDMKSMREGPRFFK